MILCGADAIYADGSVRNKVGSASLALAAHQKQIPFYVVTPSHKIKVSLPSPKYAFPGELENDDSAELEENDSSEVTETLRYDEIQKLSDNVKVRNVYFESIPSELISRVYTEQGILTHQKLTQLFTRYAQELHRYLVKKYSNPIVCKLI